MMQTASYTHCGGRPYNEDTCRLAQKGPGRVCLVVADGLGGHGGGEQASAAAVETICGNWNGLADQSVLDSLFQQANQQVLSLQTPQCAMKTTAVALALEPGKAAWAHVGDSRLYHFHNGKLVFQTKDHSVAQMAVMLGDITPDQLRFHEDRSRVLRAMGQDSTLKVATREQLLSPGRHAFLLCTDGFWEYVLEDEMQVDLNAASSPGQWLARMRSRLDQRIPAGNDNNTAAAVWLEQK